MTRNNDELSDSDDERAPAYDADPLGKNQRREPIFSRFDDDDDDDYEEPDRDTDYPSGFRADSVEEEDEFEDEFSDENAQDQFHAGDSTPRYTPDLSVAEEPDAWLEKEGYLDDDEDTREHWPLSLIAVAVVALVLLAAGGYGVMQQRAATQTELRDLRAKLATTASPENVTASRDALQNIQLSYDKLSATAEALTLENRRLADTVAGLQAQLGVQQAVLTKTLPGASQVKPAATRDTSGSPSAASGPVAPQPVTPPQVTSPSTTEEPAVHTPAAPKPTVAKPLPPKPAPKPAAKPTVATTSSGPWFVNFGSYASRNMAQTWASKLHPGAGKVIVAPNAKDGQTLYRVRVVGLADRGSAQEVARQLETQLRVAELWVGKE